MNLVQVSEMLKSMPKEWLIQEAASPSGKAPPFLVVSELSRRTNMEKAYIGDKAQGNQPSVAENVVMQASAGAGLGRGMASPINEAKAGGIVQLQSGGIVNDPFLQVGEAYDDMYMDEYAQGILAADSQRKRERERDQFIDDADARIKKEARESQIKHLEDELQSIRTQYHAFSPYSIARTQQIQDRLAELTTPPEVELATQPEVELAAQPEIDFNRDSISEWLGDEDSTTRADLMTMAGIESSYNPNAINKVGDEQVTGLYQIKDSTYIDPGFREKLDMSIDEVRQALRNPETNTKFAAKYYNYLLDQFGGNRDKAVVAFNAGLGKVREGERIAKEKGEPNNWIEHVRSKENFKDYLTKVQANRKETIRFDAGKDGSFYSEESLNTRREEASRWVKGFLDKWFPKKDNGKTEKTKKVAEEAAITTFMRQHPEIDFGMSTDRTPPEQEVIDKVVETEEEVATAVDDTTLKEEEVGKEVDSLRAIIYSPPPNFEQYKQDLQNVADSLVIPAEQSADKIYQNIKNSRQQYGTDYISQIDTEVSKLQKSLDKEKTNIPAMTLINLGLTLAMSNNPTFLGSLAEAGTSALQQYTTLKNQYNDSQKDLVAANISLLQAKAAREDKNWSRAHELAQKSTERHEAAIAAKANVDMQITTLLEDRKTAWYTATVELARTAKAEKIEVIDKNIDLLTEYLKLDSKKADDVLISLLPRMSGEFQGDFGPVDVDKMLTKEQVTKIRRELSRLLKVRGWLVGMDKEMLDLIGRVVR